MKFMISGVTSWAAQIRSPSFSRSSSSATRMSLPALISAIACSTVPNSISCPWTARRRLPVQVRRDQSLDVFPDHVSLDVHPATGPQVSKGRVAQGVFDQRHLQLITFEAVDGKAYPIQGHRSMQNECLGKRIRDSDIHENRILDLLDGRDISDPVDMALDDVAAEPAVHPHGPLHIHPVAG